MTLELTKTQTFNISASDDLFFMKLLSSEHIESELDLIFNKGVKNKVVLKFVLDNGSKLNLKVKIIIPKGSSEVETFLKFDVMVLDPDSHINITPALEILENNVKAGHAASIRKFNMDEMYYLQSRGIEIKEVKKILVDAFLT
ncbi:SufD family Fe-S cluster assembly protein [bacterium]|nr:MAG: SufD family Fe-S cluster assembly protein [bacterium]